MSSLLCKTMKKAVKMFRGSTGFIARQRCRFSSGATKRCFWCIHGQVLPYCHGHPCPSADVTLSPRSPSFSFLRVVSPSLCFRVHRCYVYDENFPSTPAANQRADPQSHAQHVRHFARKAGCYGESAGVHFWISFLQFRHMKCAFRALLGPCRVVVAGYFLLDNVSVLVLSV